MMALGCHGVCGMKNTPKYRGGRPKPIENVWSRLREGKFREFSAPWVLRRSLPLRVEEALETYGHVPTTLAGRIQIRVSLYLYIYI